MNLPTAFRFPLPLPLLAMVLLAAACSSEAPAPKPAAASQSSAPSAAVALPAGLFSTEPLEDAVPLLEAKQTAKPGDTITFTAAIAGRLDPFTKGRAVMLVADHGLPFCEASHNCPTPWDGCCETRENVLKHAATVQISDAEGRPLKTDLNGQGRLKPGARIHVQGTVAEAREGVFVVNAGKIHVETQ